MIFGLQHLCHIITEKLIDSMKRAETVEVTVI